MALERKEEGCSSTDLKHFRKEIGEMNIGEGLVVSIRRGVRSREVDMAVSPGVEDEAPRASKRRASTEAEVAMASVSWWFVCRCGML
ncbi:hypothetical protein G6F38_013940 [Rhizopus arrhizus]|nr:hypothetical protein G6F38_013940 [Rhizopus arrhizus]